MGDLMNLTKGKTLHVYFGSLFIEDKNEKPQEIETFSDLVVEYDDMIKVILSERTELVEKLQKYHSE